jgi:hypothetical protein
MAVRWYRISATTHALLESGTITNADLDLFYPAIAANANGMVIIGYNGSGIGTFVSCYAVAGQTVNGATTFGNPILLQSGATSYHDLYEEFGLATQSRWGDYSTVTVDPADSSCFWFIGMYPSDSDVWATRITQLLTVPLQLAISRSGTNVTVSWPGLAADYQLLSTTNLAPPVVWSNVTQTTLTNGSQAFVLVPISGRQQFFRLYHP